MGKLILFSGGHDSANLVKRAAPDCTALFFDYGQPAVLRETQAVLRICDDLRVPLMLKRMPALGQQGDTYMGRNLAMIALAVPIAMEMGLREIQIGCTAMDHEAFADCRDDFLAHITAATELAYGVRVSAPLESRPSYLVPGTWSCYGPGPHPCGKCRSCRQGKVE